MILSKHSVAPVVVPVSCAFASAFATYRGAPLLTFDGYYYCELAKQFTTEWPDRFGNHWPFGYPLLGALIARCGLHPFIALFVVSLIALVILNLLAAKISSLPTKERLLGLTALSCAPIVSVQLGGILTELPFAAIVLGLVVSFSQWPKRSAIWVSAALIVVALSIRYAGILGLGLMVAWILPNFRLLAHERKLGVACTSWLVAATCVAALLGLNILKSGHASGAERGDSLGLGALAAQLSDIGWSVPSALIAGGFRDAIDPSSLSGRAMGGAIVVGLSTLCIYSWIRPRSAYSRPLALVSFGYLVGMAMLRCIGNFDALFSARTFLPALFPLALILFERLAAHRVLITSLSGVLLLSGAAAATRGISREIAGDVRPALAVLKPHLREADQVAINDHAFTLAAYVHQRTIRAWPTEDRFQPEARFLVVSGAPVDRVGNTAPLDAAWRKAVDQSVQTGGYEVLLDRPTLIVLMAKPKVSP